MACDFRWCEQVISIQASPLTPGKIRHGNQTTHENLIRINAKLPPDQRAATLIHEIIGSANTTMHDKLTFLRLFTNASKIYPRFDAPERWF
jgi:hypothetical protein